MPDTFRNFMYSGNIIRKLEIGAKEFEIEIRPPTWKEAIVAEREALEELGNLISPAVNEKGVPIERSAQDNRLIALQTGYGLARKCVVRIGDVSTSEAGFWEKVPPSVIMKIGAILISLLWETEVGQKNSPDCTGKQETTESKPKL